jgi:flagellar biosynthesis protein FliQ
VSRTEKILAAMIVASIFVGLAVVVLYAVLFLAQERQLSVCGGSGCAVIICVLARRSSEMSLCYHDTAAIRSSAMTKTEYIIVGLLFACIAAGFYVALFR